MARWTLRKKTLLILGLVCLVVCVVAQYLARTVVLAGFHEVEERSVRRDVTRAINALDSRLKEIESKVADWATWDDQYAYLQGKYDGFIEENLPDAAFRNLQLNFFLFADSSERVVHVAAMDLETGKRLPTDGIRQYFSADKSLLRFPDPLSRKNGIIMLPEGPGMVALAPSLTGEQTGPPAGTLLMGRFLDARMIENLSIDTQLAVSVRDFADFRAASSESAGAGNESAEARLTKGDTVVRPRDSKSILGHGLIHDLPGAPALVLTVDIPRDIFARGEAAATYLTAGSVVIAGVLAMTIIFVLDATVLRRLRDLSGSLHAAASSGDLSTRVPVSGTDELTDVARAGNALLEALEQRTKRLKAANEELRAFSYSVSHDLRAPLRSIAGFSELLATEYAAGLPDEGKDFVDRIKKGAVHMSQLIDHYLYLARLNRETLERRDVNLSALAHRAETRLRTEGPERNVEFVIEENMHAFGDEDLLAAVVDNLFDNAWKFTSKRELGRIEFGVEHGDGGPRFFVRDNGVGFDGDYDAQKLFAPFRRLPEHAEFSGTGIGLAVVWRIVSRHEGVVSASGAAGRGATFHFSLG